MPEDARLDILTETPSVARLKACVDLVERAEPMCISAELAAIFTPENLEREPLDSRITAIMNWRLRGGFEFVSPVRESGAYAEALVRHRFTDEHWRLGVEVEPAGPHKVSALLLGRAPLPVQEATGADHEIATSFLDYVSTLAGRELFSGAVLIGRHGTILGKAAFGEANRDFSILNTVETRFNVASLTKTWTAVAICQLIEAGMLSFDTPLSDFIAYPDEESARQITIQHLLSHTSGLGGYFNDQFYQTPRDRIRSLDDFLNLAREDRPTFAPGTSWNYSNIGMILLGKVIEAITGRSYYEHVKDAIIKRASMDAAEFIELDRVNRSAAVGYHRRWTAAGPVVTNSLHEWAVKGAPDGCGFATVTDIWNFAEAFRSGRLVSAGMFEQMTTSKPELSSSDYGYGVAIHPERALVGHSGGLIGASSNLDMTFDPDGWVVVVLANDLSMRAPVLKARQLIGVTVPEADEARSYLPRGGMTAR